MKPINHEMTEDIVCPWCGWEHNNESRWIDGDRYTCDECDKPFWVSVRLYYTTKKVEQWQ